VVDLCYATTPHFAAHARVCRMARLHCGLQQPWAMCLVWSCCWAREPTLPWCPK
jgi:hypothetical protein